MYVGSAHGSGGLKSRIGRHQRANKKPHWHIDYLLPHAEIHEIWCDFASAEAEHTWVAILLREPGATTPIKGFGSSDCKSCESHLVKLSTKPAGKIAKLLRVSKIIREPKQ
jgi:Uri superfamily endonuclease